MIHIINASTVANLTNLKHIKLPDMIFRDIKVCGEGVFATYFNASSREDGGVHVTRRYNAATDSLEFLRHIKRKSRQQLYLECCHEEVPFVNSDSSVTPPPPFPCNVNLSRHGTV